MNNCFLNLHKKKNAVGLKIDGNQSRGQFWRQKLLLFIFHALLKQIKYSRVMNLTQFKTETTSINFTKINLKDLLFKDLFISQAKDEIKWKESKLRI